MLKTILGILAAAIAVEAGELGVARMHIEALTHLEPAVDRHRQRLARIDEMIAKKQGP